MCVSLASSGKLYFYIEMSMLCMSKVVGMLINNINFMGFFPTDIKNLSYEVLTAHLYRHKHYEKVTTRSSTGGAASHAI